VAKCKQRSVLNLIKNKFTITVLIAKKSTDEKDGSGNWPMSNF
jgi:hypothetical protein